jgi:thiamine biosynthesis protein ThiS
MTLTVNFATESHPEDRLSIAELLARRHWSFPLIIVRVNGEIVPRDSYATRQLVEGDVVDAHHLVSGG